MDERIRSEIQALTANNHYRQYPASKAQLARLSDLGLTGLMPDRFLGGGRYGIGYADAEAVLRAAEDAGGTTGGWTPDGDGDVVRSGASALYRLLHAEPEDDAPDLDDDPDDDPEEDYEADPADEALDRLIDEVAALEQRRFEEAGLAEMAKEMAEEIAASELRPLAAFSHLADPATLRRAALEGRLQAEKIGRDWLTDEYAVREYLKRTRARRQRGKQERPAQFVNLTPHAITVRRRDGTELNIPPAGQVARCEERRAPCGTVDGIAVTTASYGAVDGLPEPQPGTFYIVSGLVLAAVGDRRADVFAPGPAIRDGEGRIVACDGLSAGTAFARKEMPHGRLANPGRTPTIEGECNMAKGPDAIQKGIDDEVSMFESIIDSAIESSTLGYDNSVIVALDNLPSPACRIRLEKLYKDAGWQKVDFESSYRDGVWVRLVAPIRD